MTNEEAIKILEYPVKKWSMEWDEREDGLSYYEALDMAISALRQQESKPQWISVKDRLPEYPGHYLVCTSINYWHGGCMDVNVNHKYGKNGTPVGYDGTTMSVIDCYFDATGNWNRACNAHITHWMPLPEPPEEGTV